MVLFYIGIIGVSGALPEPGKIEEDPSEEEDVSPDDELPDGAELSDGAEEVPLCVSEVSATLWVSSVFCEETAALSAAL